MKKFLFIIGIIVMTFISSCDNKKTEKITEPKPVKPALPVLKVYNMGGVDDEIVDGITQKLKTIYDSTVFAGNVPFVESAHIANCNLGDNRYWAKGMFDDLRGRVNLKKQITLVIVNGEVCTWDGTKSGHAVLGLSLMNHNLSLIAYERFKTNKLNDVNNIMKIVMHELGHSVGNLVAGNDSLRFHCDNEECLMRIAGNKYPYRKITKYCSSCDSVMRAKGFKTDKMNLEEN